ncbi:hypothetical protein A2U01_0001789 [Trifolium medium]|uniref:Uncharacterized protein n=1 Tax=Trifolium medium TaxID=97028 RepID=A0A392M157_9FABA|nr:hypothetical protein [Trifolium medium]
MELVLRRIWRVCFGVLELQRRPWSCTVFCADDLVLGGGGVSFLSDVVVHCWSVSPVDLDGIGVLQSFTGDFGVVLCSVSAMRQSFLRPSRLWCRRCFELWCCIGDFGCAGVLSSGVA